MLVPAVARPAVLPVARTAARPPVATSGKTASGLKADAPPERRRIEDPPVGDHAVDSPRHCERRPAGRRRGRSDPHASLFRSCRCLRSSSSREPAPPSPPLTRRTARSRPARKARARDAGCDRARTDRCPRRSECPHDEGCLTRARLSFNSRAWIVPPSRRAIPKPFRGASSSGATLRMPGSKLSMG